MRDTISHLTYFDEQATLAMQDPAAFEEHKVAMIASMGAGEMPDVAIGRSLAGTGGAAALLERWRSSRGTLIGTARGLGAASPDSPPRITWYGPPMSLASFITARVMETWAHGADVRDALGIPLETSVSGRLRNVCHIAYGARAFTFAAHGVTDPGDPVAMIVDAPDGQTWRWGPAGDDAANLITGSALDIALVFTQRRHPSRTGVKAVGRSAEQWLAIAQAFAGPATITPEGR